MSWRRSYSCFAILCGRRCKSTLHYSLSLSPPLFLSFSIFICSFVDQKDESFYTASWACNVDGTPFVVAGGINGIIRVIDAGSEKIHKVLKYFELRVARRNVIK
jgi:hypothetical protein